MSKCRLKDFWSSGGPPIQWSRTIYAILKEGIIGNIHVKIYEIRTSGSVKRFLIWSFGGPPFRWSGIILKRHHGEHSCEAI